MGNDLRKIKAEIEEFNRKLGGILTALSLAERRKILRKAAKPMVRAAKNNVKDHPQSRGGVPRYNTPKLIQGLKAPKGKGKIRARYYPSNLRSSIAVVVFRLSKSAVFVSPRLNKKGKAQESFGRPGKWDAYYAHMVEFGTVYQSGQHYMYRAFTRTKEQVKTTAAKLVVEKINSYKKKTGL